MPFAVWNKTFGIAMSLCIKHIKAKTDSRAHTHSQAHIYIYMKIIGIPLPQTESGIFIYKNTKAALKNNAQSLCSVVC